VTTFGAGIYLEGNIIVDAEQLVRNYDPAQSTVTLVHNILPSSWSGPGTGNVVADPALRYIPKLEETMFTNWSSVQVLREWFTPMPGSPARTSRGALVRGFQPLGVAITEGPAPVTASPSAKFTIQIVRSGFGIPTSAWPNGSGYTHYRWRLDSAPWSPQCPLPPLSNLTT
jgi:hypothetical protein